MGPVLIFDKSTIQSLSAGEAQWLTHMYYSNITPVLFLEIMADLKKMSSNERTPEQWVSGPAKKFSPINSLVNVYHIDMFMTELLFGATPKMNGKVIIGGGELITDDTGRKVMFHDEQREHEALRRWKKGNFEGVRAIACREVASVVGSSRPSKLCDEFSVFADQRRPHEFDGSRCDRRSRVQR